MLKLSFLRRVIICLSFNDCVKGFTTRKVDKHYAYEEITDICFEKQVLQYRKNATAPI